MRYYGKVGYYVTKETKPGLYEQELVYRKHKGDVIRNYKRNQDASKVNSDITVNNSISIVADPYARENFSSIKCAEWQGALWSVSSVDIQHPRIILELGGLFNEDLE